MVRLHITEIVCSNRVELFLGGTTSIEQHFVTLSNRIITVTGGSGNDASAKLQAETTKDIQAMQGRFTKNAQKAVDVLLSKCCEVSLEVPSARIRATQKLYGK